LGVDADNNNYAVSLLYGQVFDTQTLFYYTSYAVAFYAFAQFFAYRYTKKVATLFVWQQIQDQMLVSKGLTSVVYFAKLVIFFDCLQFC